MSHPHIGMIGYHSTIAIKNFMAKNGVRISPDCSQPESPSSGQYGATEVFAKVPKKKTRNVHLEVYLF